MVLCRAPARMQRSPCNKYLAPLGGTLLLHASCIVALARLDFLPPTFGVLFMAHHEAVIAASGSAVHGGQYQSVCGIYDLRDLRWKQAAVAGLRVPGFISRAIITIHALAFVDGRGCGCCHPTTHEPETRILFTSSAKGGSTNSLGVPSDFGSVPIFCFLVIGTHTFPQNMSQLRLRALRGLVHGVPRLLALDPSSVCARSCSSHPRRFQ
jgi:hypothetical protein